MPRKFIRKPGNIQRWLFERTVSKDLTFTLVLLVIIVSSLVVFVTYRILYTNERNHLKAEAIEYAGYLQDSLELPIWTLDHENISKIAESCFNNELVSSLKISERFHNADGRPIDRVVFNRSKGAGAHLVNKTAYIYHSGKVIGTINIALTERVYRETLRHFLLSTTITMIVVILALIVMIQVLLRWLVNRPLAQMMTGIDQISKGDYRYHFQKFKQKEIETIAAKFANMASRIQAREESLAAVNEQLQEEVRERRKAEDAIRQSEALLRVTLDSTADGIIVVDNKERVLTVNDRFVDMWAIPGKLVEKKSNLLIVEFMKSRLKEPDLFIAKEKALRRSDTVSVEDIEFQDGRVFEWFSCPFIMEGEHIGRIWNFRDISDRKRTIKALRESEARFRQLSEAALEAIVIHDNGVVLQANERYFSMFGYERSEVIGKPGFLRTARPHPIDIMAIPNEPGDQRFTETMGFRKDQSQFPIVIRNKAMTYYGKTVNVTVIRDITERKAAEEERRMLREKLTRSQKMEALGLLAGGVAHDLNNILSGIVSYPELLLMKGGFDDKTKKALMTIQASGQRAAEVVSDLTTISRGIASSRESASINRIVKEYLSSPEYQRMKTYYPNVYLKTELDPDLLNINASRIHLRKTVMNLVTNAYEAVEKSGEVVVSTRNCYLENPLDGYSEVQSGEYAVLKISDNGPGISQEDIERIFEPFYTRKVMGRSGTGLGLTVVWNTVQDHEGYIDVASGPSGTRFELYFPVTRESVLTTPDNALAVKCQGKGEHVLVIDDEENQRVIASQILDFLGYKVTAVESGESALNYLKSHRVDLIVLDMIMPSGMDGRKTYEAIIKIRPGQRAIIASGFSITEDVKAIQQMGAGRFLKKPYTIKKLGDAVMMELSEKA